MVRKVDWRLSSTEYSGEPLNEPSANLFSRREQRTLDDERLDSGDDEDRYDRREDRMDEAPDQEDFGETVNIMDVGLARAPVPATSDGEVRKTIGELHVA